VVISGDGQYVVSGFETAYVWAWNPTQGAYTSKWTIPGNNYFVDGIATSSNPNLVAFGWTRDDTLSIRVDLYDLETGNMKWSYSGPNGTDDQFVVAEMAMDHGYLAVATWGSDPSSGCPTVYLFSSASSTPVFSYVTPGSMFAVDVLVVEQGSPEETIYVCASGKHVHANEFGNGGDLFAFATSATHTKD